jgi:hypothetical protein
MAQGHENIWICQIGRKAIDGSFETFVQQVSQAAIQVSALHVDFNAHGTGRLEFGWEGPFIVNGKPVALENYPRWDNSYAQVAFGSEQFHIGFEGESLNLDFQSGVRLPG